MQEERLKINHDEADPDLDDARAIPSSSTARPVHARFDAQDVYSLPSAYIAALIEDLPEDQRLTRDQTLFMVRFARCCDEAWEDEQKEPNQRRVHHLLLLGQGGSGKTHVVQKLVFQAVMYIWPPDENGALSLMVVASSNAQAKNISTAECRARTIHNACSMRVQQLVNAKLRPGNKQKLLTTLWEPVRVLIVEEISMVAAALYNALDVRSMHGRSRTYDVSESNYRHPGHHFGRVPIVIKLGDFLQLSPTANIGLIQDVNEKLPDGTYKHPEPPSLEVQHAIRLFASVPYVFELKGTKRFKAGDPLIEFLACMRVGRKFPGHIWKAFAKTFASDGCGELDQRHSNDRFRDGYGMGMYWETLSRWISQRAVRDAHSLAVPLVFLQAVDECNTIDRESAQRLLNVPNLHNTGHIHGVLPSHVGMRVRFTIKLNSQLVQEQRATIVDFLFKEEDRTRYATCGAGELFRPKFCPAGIWLHVDDFRDSPVWEDAMLLMPQDDGECCSCCNGVTAAYAKGLLLFEPIETTFAWRSSETHSVRRVGFPLTHASYLTSTASQGQTIRTGVTIDCARVQQQGRQGMKDEEWWLHLYVMFSRVTRIEDMLLLRPPPRELLEAGPPPSVRTALERFEHKIGSSIEAAELLAASMGIRVPS